MLSLCDELKLIQLFLKAFAQSPQALGVPKRYFFDKQQSLISSPFHRIKEAAWFIFVYPPTALDAYHFLWDDISVATHRRRHQPPTALSHELIIQLTEIMESLPGCIEKNRTYLNLFDLFWYLNWKLNWCFVIFIPHLLYLQIKLQCFIFFIQMIV